MRKLLILYTVLLIITISATFVFAADDGNFSGNSSGAGTTEIEKAAAAAEDFPSFAALCMANQCGEDCNQFTAQTKDGMAMMVNAWNKMHPDDQVSVSVAGTVGHMCHVENKTINMNKAQAAFDAAGGSRESAFSGSCPCPGGVEVKKDGCSLTFVCKMADDFSKEISANVPCPQIMGTDPKYPLVKMLSGTLIEWNQTPTVSTPGSVSYGAPGGLSAPGSYFGAEYYIIDFDVTLSSIDLGSKVKFTIGAANAAKNRKDALTRSNIEYYLKGDNEYVEVLTQKDIYDAYKSRSKYVQAYLALENKHYGERPWNTYEKFIKGMCNMSSDYGRCLDELLVIGHKDTEMQGDLYLGNGDMSIIGVYSEVSSHSCHGASVVNDQGQPAFAIEIESEWCFYVNATWKVMSYQVIEQKYLGKCCDDWKYDEVGSHEICDDETGCVTYTDYAWVCHHYQDKYMIKEGWREISSSGTNSGSCGTCATITGYMDENGYATTEPLATSFYQSQPLLIKPAE